jgi:hypothetical protein
MEGVWIEPVTAQVMITLSATTTVLPGRIFPMGYAFVAQAGKS